MRASAQREEGGWVAARASAGRPAQNLAGTVLSIQRLAGNRAVAAAVQRVPPTKLASTSVGAEISGSGEMTGTSKLEHAAVKKRLRKQRLPTDELSVRIEMLVPKIDEAFDRMMDERRRAAVAGVRGQEVPAVVGVVTAPEWFFKRPGTPFTAADKATFDAAFIRLSRMRPGLAIIPGTIVWSQGNGPGDEVRATAVVFKDGVVVKEVNKLGDLGDTSGYQPSVAGKWRQPAVVSLDGASTSAVANESSYFTLGPLTVALEVCGDHSGAARARADAAVTGTGAAGVDLHILVSNGAARTAGADMTRPGGVFLHNDASPGLAIRSMATNTSSTAGRATVAGPSTGPSNGGPLVDLHAVVTIAARTRDDRRQQAAELVRPLRAQLMGLRATWDGAKAQLATPMPKPTDEARRTASVAAMATQEARIDPIAGAAGALWSAPGPLPAGNEAATVAAAIAVLDDLIAVLAALPLFANGYLQLQRRVLTVRHALTQLSAAGL